MNPLYNPRVPLSTDVVGSACSVAHTPTIYADPNSNITSTRPGRGVCSRTDVVLSTEKEIYPLGVAMKNQNYLDKDFLEKRQNLRHVNARDGGRRVAYNHTTHTRPYYSYSKLEAEEIEKRIKYDDLYPHFTSSTELNTRGGLALGEGRFFPPGTASKAYLPSNAAYGSTTDFTSHTDASVTSSTHGIGSASGRFANGSSAWDKQGYNAEYTPSTLTNTNDERKEIITNLKVTFPRGRYKRQFYTTVSQGANLLPPLTDASGKELTYGRLGYPFTDKVLRETAYSHSPRSGRVSHHSPDHPHTSRINAPPPNTPAHARGEKDVMEFGNPRKFKNLHQWK